MKILPSSNKLIKEMKDRSNRFVGFVKESSRRDKSIVFALSILFLLIFCAISADFVAPRPYWDQDLPKKLLPPSLEYPLGTDPLGRDVLSRIIYGARILLYSVSRVLLISTCIGLIMGLVSGYYGGIADLLIMRVVDLLLCFPHIILAFGMLAVLGVGLENAITAASIYYIGPFARLTRGQALSTKELLYIDNARVIGCSDMRIIFRHILPNIVSPLIVQVTFNAAGAILLIGALGFIGLGAQPPTPDWGTMMYEARGYMNISIYPLVFPGLAIFAAASSFNILGETLRDYWDIRERTL